jgi:hypothetical protein
VIGERRPFKQKFGNLEAAARGVALKQDLQEVASETNEGAPTSASLFLNFAADTATAVSSSRFLNY